MSFEIAEEVLAKTTCTNDFICVKDENFALCKVQDSFDNGQILFVNPNANRECNCKLTTFGYSTLCPCPTRKEIFRKYKI